MRCVRCVGCCVCCVWRVLCGVAGGVGGRGVGWRCGVGMVWVVGVVGGVWCVLLV